ncbi:hypothetical protein BDK51DRAFT_49277 [Blyttiomyces helicus]|uniref:Uncharacterized protein n=1 Tax=Blyttiomyces helicus TaxID=388810 RepID=A0A4P9VWE1_9FUNG|nr:hypothetical protein BDK51DRAFT_49277 [Blyttiomyces helicus]|eukprot:RKO82993.1 hypothetical protein BDK51DRAFT_49277 [Blyttiomyces helicus]
MSKLLRSSSPRRRLPSLVGWHLRRRRGLPGLRAMAGAATPHGGGRFCRGTANVGDDARHLASPSVSNIPCGRQTRGTSHPLFLRPRVHESETPGDGGSLTDHPCTGGATGDDRFVAAVRCSTQNYGAGQTPVRSFVRGAEFHIEGIFPESLLELMVSSAVHQFRNLRFVSFFSRGFDAPGLFRSAPAFSSPARTSSRSCLRGLSGNVTIPHRKTSERPGALGRRSSRASEGCRLLNSKPPDCGDLNFKIALVEGAEPKFSPLNPRIRT